MGYRTKFSKKAQARAANAAPTNWFMFKYLSNWVNHGSQSHLEGFLESSGQTKKHQASSETQQHNWPCCIPSHPQTATRTQSEHVDDREDKISAISCRSVVPSFQVSLVSHPWLLQRDDDVSGNILYVCIHTYIHYITLHDMT